MTTETVAVVRDDRGVKYVALFAILIGCSSQTQEHPPAVVGGDSGAADTTSAPEASVDEPLPDTANCNDLAQKSAQVMPVRGASFPAFEGGTIADGTYVLTKVEVYDGPITGGPMAFTIVVSGGTMRWIVTSGSDVLRLNLTIMPAPPKMLQLQATCPPGPADDKPRPYHATPTELVIGHDDLVFAWFFKKL